MSIDLALLDWVIIITILIFSYRGFHQGFVQQLIGIIGSVVAIISAFYFYDKIGLMLADWLDISENLAVILGFILITTTIGGVFNLIGKKWKDATDDSSISALDGIGGAVLGAGKVLIIWIGIMFLLSSLPWEFIQTPLWESTLAQDVLELASRFAFLQEKVFPTNVPGL